MRVLHIGHFLMGDKCRCFMLWLKKSAIEGGKNYVSYFMGSMALGARARLKVNEIVPRVGLHGSLMR